MQNKNKPLLLRPSGKDYLWGGSRLNDEFEKNIEDVYKRQYGMFYRFGLIEVPVKQDEPRSDPTS